MRLILGFRGEVGKGWFKGGGVRSLEALLMEFCCLVADMDFV
jgi:hypothetical protein